MALSERCLSVNLFRLWLLGVVGIFDEFEVFGRKETSGINLQFIFYEGSEKIGVGIKIAVSKLAPNSNQALSVRRQIKTTAKNFQTNDRSKNIDDRCQIITGNRVKRK